MALSAAGIAADVERPSVALDPEVEAVLAWAVREGATNVIRHSGARHCTVRSARGSARPRWRWSTTAGQAGGSGPGSAPADGVGQRVKRARARRAARARRERCAGRIEAGRCPGRWLPPGRADPEAGRSG